MAGARHGAPPSRGPVHLLANALCSAVVVVGVGTLLLGGRASGYADEAEPSTAVLAVGHAVVPDGLFPGGAVTGRLPVTNSSADDAQVTGVVFALPVADAAHRGCRVGSVVLSPVTLPVVPGSAAQSIPFSVTMSSAAGNECQGATFTSRYTITARPA